MATTEASERVVVILDGSREVINPSTFSFMGARKLMGFRSKLESGSIFGPNKRIAVEEMGKKLEEYRNNAEIVGISKQCKKEQIQFRIEMLAGYPLREVAARFVKKIRATWLVLDRHMKNDQEHEGEGVRKSVSRSSASVSSITEHSPVSIDESGDQKDLHSPDENSKQHNETMIGWGEIQRSSVQKLAVFDMQKSEARIGWMRLHLCRAPSCTEGFNDKNFLSEGGFGSVYKGEINGLKIAVKQYKYNASLQGEREFKSEVNASDGETRGIWSCWLVLAPKETIGYLSTNTFAMSTPEDLLVGKEARRLAWQELKHEDSDKSSETITRVVGTLGYLAPEYAECGKGSTKTDVYSFGVVLLQLITGMKTTDKRLKGKALNYPDLIDERILDSHDVHQLFWMVRVAEKCLTKDPKKRLSMDKVVFALNYITDRQSTCSIEVSLLHNQTLLPPSPPIWRTSNVSPFLPSLHPPVARS
ncbi:hypothetical protein F3Y22_tig00112114pilonHSYRG00056 [Hibiscus syriacus]|uniref:non-specific serine/threonine protein kinase n=1 Tax=Hibiscus syriacus TaxID=106335 RepID=A0A6A2XUY3_HIBSY|nr:hypothetical protein F3Y22_tig00112114pilonHSYRG00056 [Hibiscus syriacus]